MRILVTGAAGLIGRAAITDLDAAGLDVVPLFHRHVQGEGRAGALHVDLAVNGARTELAAVDFDAIIHCAAIFPRPGLEMAPELIAERNRVIDNVVLEVAVERKCPVVFLSSVSVYGEAPNPWSEASIPHPLGPYARAKLESERCFLERVEKCVCLRVSSPYGIGQTTFNVLRLFLERAMHGQDLLYYGSGNRTQDFIAADDVAAAARAAITNGRVNGVFNIASGSAISMRKLAQLVVESVPGGRSRVQASGAPDPQEAFRAEIDIAKARQELNWRPVVPLDVGIRNWVRRLGASSC